MKRKQEVQFASTHALQTTIYLLLTKSLSIIDAAGATEVSVAVCMLVWAWQAALKGPPYVEVFGTRSMDG
jgi:hypothetical protein